MTVAFPEMPPPSEEALARLEQSYGGLPDDFRQFLSRHNGARPGENLLRLQDGSTSLAEFVPAEEMLDLKSAVDGFPDSALPVARDGTGNFIYIEESTGHIYFWNHEVEGEDQRIADSFGDFLAKLERGNFDRAELGPYRVKSVWVDPDFKPEF